MQRDKPTSQPKEEPNDTDKLRRSEMLQALQPLLKKEEKTKGDFRYSKKYLKNLGIDIGDRGGILRILDKKTGQYGLYAIVKNDRNKGVRLGEGCSAVCKAIENLETGEWKTLKILKDENDNNNYFQNECKWNERLGRGSSSMIEKKRAPDEASKTARLAAIQDFVPGITLKQLMKDSNSTNPLSLSERLNICIQACKLVNHLHKVFELAHRDLHDENIMYDPETKKVNIIDFGLAKENKNNHRDDDDIVDLVIVIKDILKDFSTTEITNLIDTIRAPIISLEKVITLLEETERKISSQKTSAIGIFSTQPDKMATPGAGETQENKLYPEISRS